MIKRFTNIMQKSGAFREYDIFSKFSSHKPGKISHFHRMLQNILTVACPELQSAENLDQIRMQGVYSYLECSLFPVLTDTFIHFSA
ncbi:hypothetical protein D3C81_1428380 [compost metagenome]